MTNTIFALTVAFASLTLVACSGAPPPTGAGTRAAASETLPPGLGDTAGALKFMQCISKLDGGDDLTELRVGNGRYLVCTSYDVNNGQATQEEMDDNGAIWDVTWRYDSIVAKGPSEVVLEMTTNSVGQPWVVKATRDGDEVVIPIPTWSGAEVSPIWIDVGGTVTGWTPAAPTS